jgi:hypothetical protein
MPSGCGTPGVPANEAEVHAAAARDFIMTELVTKQDLDIRMRAFEQRIDSRIDNLELRLMVRMGGMLAVAVAILAAIIKF